MKAFCVNSSIDSLCIKCYYAHEKTTENRVEVKVIFKIECYKAMTMRDGFITITNKPL